VFLSAVDAYICVSHGTYMETLLIEDMAMRPSEKDGAWVVFDGDNTLWDVERLYDDARDALCALLASMGHDPKAVEDFQRSTDQQLHKELGYSRERFPLSFTQTARHFQGEAADDAIEAARTLAEAVFTTAAEVADDLDAVLRSLGERYRLAMLTAGDSDIQKSRLAAFGRAHHFQIVQIVALKTEDVFRQFLAQCGAEPGASWMVGDSLKSDILPAVAAGMNAIHLEKKNWHEVEMAGSALPPHAFRAASLTDAASIILGRVATA